LNDFEKTIQDLRGSCERDIASSVEKTIENLNQVLDKNQMVRDSVAQGGTNPIAMNQRRGFLNEIAYAIPIRVTSNPNGSVNVFGPQGNLIDGTVLPISFKQTSGHERSLCLSREFTRFKHQ
jgi:flagellar hook-associated protein FlgK